MPKGLTIIYWGFGKGKTTAAMGTALRALGQGLRVLIVQFMKGGGKEGWETGEEKMFQWLEDQFRRSARLQPRQATLKGRTTFPSHAYLEYHIVGKGWVKIRGDNKRFEDHEQAAQSGFDYCLQQIVNGKWNLVILDEILSAVDSALLTVDDIKKLIAVKPPPVHLLMTGHKEYPELTELADLVTRMEKIKHPYDKGLLAQKGIDF